MSKAEKYIDDCTRNCSNELCSVEDRFGKKVILYHEWLTPDHAREALSINPDKWMPYYKEYLKEWFGNLRLLSVNAKAPYMFIPMELEAYGMEYESDYIFYADGTPRPVGIWKEIKAKIPVSMRKELAKKWYSNKKDYKDFSEFVKKEVFSLI